MCYLYVYKSTVPELFELVVPVSLSLVCFRMIGRSEEDQKRCVRKAALWVDHFFDERNNSK